MFSRPLAILLLLAFALGFAFGPAFGREKIALNQEWSFHLGDVEGAQARDFDATTWRRLTLPHDWSIELPRAESSSAGGHGGFFEHGLGWYRREFEAPIKWNGQTVEVEFEGVYRNAEVWLNGVAIARQPYGYTPIRADLTPHLRLGERNVLAVRVDNSAQPSARWYTGSGIYRPVWLHVRAPVSVSGDGVWVNTLTLTPHSAEIEIHTAVANASAEATTAQVSHRVLASDGREVARLPATAIKVEPRAEQPLVQKVAIGAPLAWLPERPVLYRLETKVEAGDRVTDSLETVFGIRTVQVSAERGFELNGQSIELNGGNVHHDTGPLGAVALARAEERKVELLKAAGFNAVRTAHNPPSRAFLEACDRLGLLVMNEIFDGWAKAKTKHDYGALFAEWWRRDVDAWVKRDRPHPSVVMWSVGNEMFERGNAEGLRIARELVARVKELDPTRPVTAGVNGLGTSGKWEQLDPLFAAFDVAGYNYELARQADDHARLPNRIIVAAESYQREVFANWAATQDHAYVIGDFVWSALDYLGEAGIGRVYRSDEAALKHWEGSMWPWHGGYCGDLDLTGWRKPISHYRNIVWDRGEKLYVAVQVPSPDGKPWNVTPWSLPPALPSWTWPGREGERMAVEVYSRYDAVRLELNGTPIGGAPTGRAQEFRARFEVPFSVGELVAVGLAGGVAVERFTLRSADSPVALRAAADRSRLAADGQDLAFITIEAIDGVGTLNPAAAHAVEIVIEGPGELAAFGTGDLTSAESYRASTRALFQGRALAVIRTSVEPGEIRVRLQSPGLAPATVILNSTR